MKTYSTQIAKMTTQRLDSKIYSGGKGARVQVTRSSAELFVHLKNIFFTGMAQCILMCLAPGVTREKMHVGVNTLSNSINI